MVCYLFPDLGKRHRMRTSTKGTQRPADAAKFFSDPPKTRWWRANISDMPETLPVAVEPDCQNGSQIGLHGRRILFSQTSGKNAFQINLKHKKKKHP